MAEVTRLMPQYHRIGVLMIRRDTREILFEKVMSCKVSKRQLCAIQEEPSHTGY